MNAASLDTKIIIQSKIVTRDSFGGESVSWANQASVWAQVSPWRMRERMNIARQVGDSTVSLLVRYPVTLSLDNRILMADIPYNVIEIDASRKRNGELMFIVRGEDIGGS